MLRAALAAALALALAALPAAAQEAEKPVDPYEISDANAGATPIEDARLFETFGGREGVARIVDRLIDLNVADSRVKDIFAAMDRPRLERTLGEQLCYVLGGGCRYTGRDMASAHKDMGLTTKDLAILVEHLQTAMEAEGVPYRAQNRLLAKLAPMKRVVVER